MHSLHKHYSWLAAALLIALDLLEVHGPDGQIAFVNVHEIASIRAPNSGDLGRFTKGSHCIVLTTDGKFLAVVETCAELRATLSGR